MPKFYFNYRTDNAYIVDPVGQDLPDLEAAHEQAADIGQVMLAKALDRGDAPAAARCIEIIDENGAEVLYVVFWASAAKPNSLAVEHLLKSPTLH